MRLVAADVLAAFPLTRVGAESGRSRSIVTPELHHRAPARRTAGSISRPQEPWRGVGVGHRDGRSWTPSMVLVHDVHPPDGQWGLVGCSTVSLNAAVRRCSPDR